MSGSELVLGYWDIRGLAEPIRMLLAHFEVPFEDKQYVVGPAPEFSRIDWTNAKETLRLDFPNLPYLLDGDIRITESKAIVKYLCEKYRPEYLGLGLEEQTRVEEINSLVDTITWQIYPICYRETFAQDKGPMLENIKAPLQRIGKVLERSRFLVGRQPSYVDFNFFEVLQILAQIEPGYLTGISGNFVGYQAHVRSLAHVVEFENRHSPRLYFCAPQAVFNIAVL